MAERELSLSVILSVINKASESLVDFSKDVEVVSKCIKDVDSISSKTSESMSKFSESTHDASQKLADISKHSRVSSSEIKTLDTTIGSITEKIKNFVVSSAFIGGVSTFYSKAISSSADLEIAMKRLETTMASAGVSWENSSEDINNWIDAMQKTTMYTDDQLIPALDKMIGYVGDTATAMELVNLATNMASAKVVDFESAVRLLGQAFNGNINALLRYVPSLRNLIDESDELEMSTEMLLDVLDELKYKFDGIAKNEAKTFYGAMNNLNDSFSEFVRRIGDDIRPKIQTFIEAIGSILEAIIDLDNKHKGLISTLDNLVLMIPVVTLALKGLISSFTAVGAAITLGLDALLSYLEGQQEQKRQAENLCRTHEDLIKRYYDEIKALEAKLAKEKEGSEKSIEIMERIAALKKAIAYQERLIEEEKNKAILQNQKESGEKMKSLVDKQVTEKISKQEEYNRETEKKSKELNEKVYVIHKMGWAKIQQLVEASENEYVKKIFQISQKIGTYAESIKPIFEELITPITSALADTANAYVSMMTTKIDVVTDKALQAQMDIYYAERDRILTTIEDETKKQEMLENLETDHERKMINIRREAAQKEREEKKKVKGIMIMEAIANTSLAVTKALSSYYFPINFAIAALVLAKGMFEVERIKAQEFAKGVKNFFGGYAIVGEKGAELVELPAGSNVYSHNQSMNMLATTGAGINLTVNLTGNYIFSEAQAGELADIVSEVIIKKVKKERLI